VNPEIVSNIIPAMHNTMIPIFRFFTESAWARRHDLGTVCDFAFGNPHDMPLPLYVEALQKAIIPQNKDWFAYKQSEAEAQVVVSASLSERLGHPFAAEDICLTNGAFAGLNIAIKTIINAGDEVIFITPNWFFYESMIISAGGKAVKVGIDPVSFDLDLAAIQAALSPRTRAIIINSPHNPTGKIYGRDTLMALAHILEEASRQNGRTIYLISDEAYNQIIFDNNTFISPATIYPHTFLVYTFGKVHLTPGQRIGYIALPSQMPNREEIRQALTLMQVFSGWSFPNALLQHALADLVTLSIDIAQLQARRDRFQQVLSEIGYETNDPEGTFYLLIKSPLADDWEFTEQLAQHDVFILPGVTFGLPGYCRISLTGNDDMVERSLPKFAAAFEAVT
jgi:aspartate aminotransferase